MAYVVISLSFLLLASIVLLCLWNGVYLPSHSLSFGGGHARCKGPHGQNVDQIRNGIYDTSPFNRDKLSPPFFRYRAEYQVAPAYNLSFCRIEKVMTTIFDAIMCYINNPVEFEVHNRRISTELYQTRFCADRNLFLDLEGVYEAIGPRRTELVVVRHPIDRFLSGFADKCLREALRQPERCYACNGDMDCFLTALVKDMDDVFNKNAYEYSYELHHFAPQTWYCDFTSHLDKYTIVKYESGPHGALNMANQFDFVFRRAGVPSKIRREIRKELLVDRNKHATFGTEQRRRAEHMLMSNLTLLTRVTQIFYYDFIVFDYQLPVLI